MGAESSSSSTDNAVAISEQEIKEKEEAERLAKEQTERQNEIAVGRLFNTARNSAGVL